MSEFMNHAPNPSIRVAIHRIIFKVYCNQDLLADYVDLDQNGS